MAPKCQSLYQPLDVDGSEHGDLVRCQLDEGHPVSGRLKPWPGSFSSHISDKGHTLFRWLNVDEVKMPNENLIPLIEEAARHAFASRSGWGDLSVEYKAEQALFDQWLAYCDENAYSSKLALLVDVEAIARLLYPGAFDSTWVNATQQVSQQQGAREQARRVVDYLLGNLDLPPLTQLDRVKALLKKAQEQNLETEGDIEYVAFSGLVDDLTDILGVIE